MHPNRLARLAALAAAGLTGLGLCWWCLGSAQAQAGAPIVDIGAYEVNDLLFLPLVRR
jgi:hypothetical protein